MSGRMRTWRQLIEYAMQGDQWDKGTGDKIEDILVIDPPDLDLDLKFDAGYGGTCGHSFYAWTEKFVYFPVCYDGSEWVGFVPRGPVTTEIEPQHWGGG